MKTIQHLESVGVLKLIRDTTATPPDTDRLPLATNIESDNQERCPTYVRTYVRTNEQGARAPDFDFEALYQKYPRKVGKSDGLKRCKAQIKTIEDYDALSAAIDRYRNYIRAQGTEEKFIKHFPTFMSSWRDWLDPGAGKSIVNQPVQPLRSERPPDEHRPPDPTMVSQMLGRFSMQQMPRESA